jgi:hypothetical protein
MDVNGFREAQSPFFFNQPPTYLVEVTTARVALPPQKTTLPTPDSRFPGYAAPMTDGRVMTDYRAPCETAIPSHQSYAVRHWMQRNGDEILTTSRARAAAATGAGRPMANTEMPARIFVHCDPQMCVRESGERTGVGQVRRETVPPLFGTFASPGRFTGRTPVVPLTHHYEGGRNTPR